MKRALVIVAMLLAPSVAAADISHIIYLNRCVGTCEVIASNSNNAQTNESSIPIFGGATPGDRFSLQAFRWGDATWDAVVACVKEVYAPYDVEIVTEDPGDVAHHEQMVGGLPADIHYSNAGGVSSGGFGCDPKDNGLSFTFANETSDVEWLCSTVAQESAHSFGLPDHIFDCTDPMTYLSGCPRAFFRNKLMPCGEGSPRDCQCGGARVNTHIQLLDVFGPGVDPAPPEATLVAPIDGAIITDATQVQVSATDERGIGHIEVYFNGWPWGSYVEPESITGPFQWPTSFTIDPDDGFPDGVIDVEVRVANDLDSTTVLNATVTKGSACTSADSCLAGQRCDEGRCLWDAPTGQLGDACTYNQFCEGPNTYDGVCVTDGDLSMCTRACFSGVNDNCPSGFACKPDDGTSGAGVCWLPVPEETCTDCSGGGGGEMPVMMGLALGAIVLRRRKRTTPTSSRP